MIPIPGLENYHINDNAEIWSTKTCKMLSTNKVCNGYKMISLEGKSYLVHRLVALTYIPNEDPLKNIVNHINGDKLDNRACNLEWVTQKQNVAQNVKNTSHSRKVIQMNNDNTQIAIFDSVTEAANKIGASRSAISKACLGINGSAFGFKFKYKDSSHNHVMLTSDEGVQITGYQNYKVFRDGSIYSTARKSFLKPVKNASGYEYVTLSCNGVKQNHYIHRLVAMHYLENNNENNVVNHIDLNKSNNNIENLEWISSSNNRIHAHIIRSTVLS